MTHTYDACIQGDNNFMSGAVCLAAMLAGDQATVEDACGDTANGQDADGRWWRGPSLKGVPYDPSFSRDQARGTLSYLLAKGYISDDPEDHEEAYLAGGRWLEWVTGQGQARICSDDTRTCDITVGTANLMFNTFRHVGLFPTQDEGFSRKLRRSQWWLTKGLYAETLLNWFDFKTRGKFYPFNLKAMSVLLLRAQNMDPDREFRVRNRNIAKGLGRVARALHRQDLDNPFFDFMRNGNRESLVAKVLDRCPDERPDLSDRGNWGDWQYQRHSSEKAWERTLGWDCVFMIDLMLAKDSGRLSW
jgi:hypothetical protein